MIHFGENSRQKLVYSSCCRDLSLDQDPAIECAKVDMTAPAPIRYRAQSPQIEPAASANGALETIRDSGGSMPMTATVHNIYMAVLMSVPYMVALGMFFSGDSMDVEGMVAHSSPKKQKSERSSLYYGHQAG